MSCIKTEPTAKEIREIPVRIVRLNKIYEAFDDAWLSCRITTLTLKGDQTGVIRDYLSRQKIYIPFTDEEISALWTSYLKTRIPDDKRWRTYERRHT